MVPKAWRIPAAPSQSGDTRVTVSTVRAGPVAGSRAAGGSDLLEKLSAQLHERVPFDGGALFSTDPATLMPTLPMRIENVHPRFCDAYWTGEFQEQDVMLYRDLARSPEGVDTLLHATGHVPSRSHRYREFLRPQGFGDELRATFRLGGCTWGVVDLCREAGRPAFTAEEVALVAAIGPVIAAALRAHVAAPAPAATVPAEAPGTALYGMDGSLVSMDEQAESWFLELAGPGWDAPVPPPAMVAVASVVARANAVANGRERGVSTSRVRAANGRWISLHASGTRAVGGTAGLTVLVIQAARSAQIAPIIAEAYSLTTREREITEAVARGRSNAEIARELCLSAHTVRDHLTAVFGKVGVASRGELVAKLFADVYQPGLRHVHAVGA